MRVPFFAGALLLATTSCGSHSEPGSPAVVSIEPVPVRWVVVSITYPVPGNESWVWYDQPTVTFPGVDADRGARWSGAVRSAAWGERVARLAPIDMQPATAVTASSVALGGATTNGFGMGGDALPHSLDWFRVWLNPTAVVTTDAAGGRTVAWSSTDSAEPCALAPYLCNPGYAAFGYFTAGELAGTTPPLSDSHRAILDWLGPADRAAILAHDPFFDPAFDPATIPSDARFERLADFALSDQAAPASSILSWTSCSGAVTDAGSPVLLDREIPFGNGETFVMQYSFFSPTTACETQRPGVILGTSTPGCAMEGGLYVDRVFGTVLPVVSSASRSCTQ